MLASLLSNLLDIQYWFSNPWLPLTSLFSLWMFIDAVRRREWVWAFFIFVGFGVSALFYYFAVYRAAPAATRGFELPGARLIVHVENDLFDESSDVALRAESKRQKEKGKSRK